MKDREIFVISIIVENLILRNLKKNLRKSVEGFRSYGQNRGRIGIVFPKIVSG
jgi:hypothetical protein